MAESRTRYAVFAASPATVGLPEWQRRRHREVLAASLASSDIESTLVELCGRLESDRAVVVAGSVDAPNDGSNFPWWSWCIRDLSISPAGPDKPPDLEVVLSGGKELTSGEGLVAHATPLALLDEEGRVQHGELRLGQLRLGDADVSRETWMPPRNEFQRLVWSTFRPDPTASRDFALLKDRLDAFASHDRPREPVYIVFMPRSDERRVFGFRTFGVGSLGLPRGSHRNPHYHHTIELNSDDFSAMLHFQHSLPDLVGREILFRHNTGLVSNYQEPIGLWCGNTVMPGGRPVLEGILRINQLEAQPKTGFLATLDAEAVFWPDEVRGVPRSDERPPGYLKIKITDKTLLRRPEPPY